MKRVLKILLFIFLFISVWLGYRVYDNNRAAAIPAQTEIQSAYDAGIEWLLENREAVLSDTNSILWSMLQKASLITDDKQLITLVEAYLKRHEARLRNSYWKQLFHENIWVPVTFEKIKHLPEYNQYFVYGLTCDEDLAKQPAIMEQNRADFCNSQRLRPACVTHQMMGMLMLENKQCKTSFDIPTVKEQLQQRIYQQLRWDPRGVVDVTIQRVLMLMESGSGNSVKPVWVKKILLAQRSDGGWSGSQPLYSKLAAKILLSEAKVWYTYP